MKKKTERQKTVILKTGRREAHHREEPSGMTGPCFGRVCACLLEIIAALIINNTFYGHESQP